MERSSQTYTPLGIGSGTIIAGRYEIDRKIGAGATSAVYRARDKALGNTICAIKIIDTKSLNSSNDLERIKNEVLITRKLTHPNVVRTYEYGTTDSGQLFITMEYVEGKSLESLLSASKREGLLPTAEVVYYLKAIASALASAHEAQIIHRDLKPANVLVSKNGDVKITDFGLAKQQELDLKLTTEGECVGTPAYMSPEQIQGHKLDHRTDIYSFGILAFELFTGNLPFKGNDWFSLGKSIIMDSLPDMGYNKPPDWLCDLIKACTSKDKEDRPLNFNEVLEQLDNITLNESDISTRISQIRFKKQILNAGSNLIKFAPFIFILCIVAFVLVLLVQSGEIATTKVATKVDQADDKINKMVDTMNKTITVLQKLDQNSEAIDKVFNKVAIQETQEENKEPKQEAKSEQASPEKQDEDTADDQTRGPILKNRIKRFKF